MRAARANEKWLTQKTQAGTENYCLIIMRKNFYFPRLLVPLLGNIHTTYTLEARCGNFLKSVKTKKDSNIDGAKIK
jgi:hypothetical protein